VVRGLILLLALLTFASTAQAAPPSPVAEPGALDAPWPTPDPRSWWDDPRPKPAEAADPLGGRRATRGAPPIAAGVDPLLYRLWGLPPLQAQTLKPGEMVLELWVHMSLSPRQAVARVVVRRDGAAFVQARAGLACCTPEIGRRVGFDVRLDDSQAARLLKLKDDPLWDTPRDVRVVEGEGAADALCVNGIAYELTLATPERIRSVRRACDPQEVGEAADVLEAVLTAALGHEPRFDLVFPDGADFSAARKAHGALVKAGGRLRAAPGGRPQPPSPQNPPDS
jgi:hypothetical protein